MPGTFTNHRKISSLTRGTIRQVESIDVYEYISPVWLDAVKLIVTDLLRDQELGVANYAAVVRD